MKYQELILPLLLWLALTIVYGVALQVFRVYDQLSFLYHIGLLLLALFFARSFLGLGLRVGKIRYGATACIGFLIYVLVHSIIFKPQFELGLNLVTLSTLFFSPITEELFWRGLMFQRMVKSLDVERAVVGNACLFALMHLPMIIFFGDTAFTLILMLAYGILFSLTYYVSNSTYYPIIMHIINNIFAS